MCWLDLNNRPRKGFTIGWSVFDFFPILENEYIAVDLLSICFTYSNEFSSKKSANFDVRLWDARAVKF